MAMISCRECGAQVSDGAKKCPKCGIETPSKSKKKFKEIYEALLGVIVWIFIAFIGFGAYGWYVGRGTCEISNLEARAEIFIVNNEPDYGAIGSASLRNTGRSGDFLVEMTLETSTGDIQKKMTVAIADGAVRDVAFQFTEPVIGTEIQRIRARCGRA